MSNNRIGDEGAIAIAKCLAKNEPLLYLSLDHNQIGPIGSSALAGALGDSRLMMLSLLWNPIADTGAAALFTALEGNKFMKLFCMDGSQIGVTCRVALAQTLRANKTLTSLRLNNDIADADAAVIGAALKENTTLVSLGLRSRALSYEGVNSIAQGLKTNIRLRSLYLERDLDPRFKTVCGLAMIDTLKTNYTLTTLVSPCNNEQMQVINQMLARNIHAASRKTEAAVATISALNIIRGRGGENMWAMAREIIRTIGQMIKFDETRNSEWVMPVQKPKKSLKLVFTIPPGTVSKVRKPAVQEPEELMPSDHGKRI